MNILVYFKKNYSIFAIIFIAIFFLKVIKDQDSKKYEIKIIEWDVKSYYAYLPAAFIYNDLSFEFIYTGKYSDKLKTEIWPIRIKETNKLIIKTTMGMSYIYLPAFLIAHNIAKHLGYKADGYSKPYDFSILFLALFYLILGLIYLRKLLLFLKFNELSIFITLLTICIGTNLSYYVTFEAGMTHVYNFTLITIFVYNTAIWWEKQKIKNLIFLGLLGGLITLIRPTNILVYLIFIFWNISSLSEIKNRIKFFIVNFKIPVLLIILYLIPWIPQIIFWKIQTGHYLYFSYGDNSEKFFFNNPQIFNILFSYWKGWYLYTPIMFIATIGLITLFKKYKSLSILIFIYISIMIYILSSWWSWWFGGGYGNRAFIDFYGIMAIPLASLIMFFIKQKYANIILLSVLVILIWYNTFQIKQYFSGALHYWSMSKEMYWEQFLKKERTEHFKEIIMIPDNEAALKGIFRLIPEKKEYIKKEYNFNILNTLNNSIVSLSSDDYIKNLNEEILVILKNKINHITLFNTHKINKLEFNTIFYFKAKEFIKNNVDSIKLNLTIKNCNNIKNCNLILSIESNKEFKLKRKIKITESCNISESIILPDNISETDMIKAYIYQYSDKKNTFDIENAELSFSYK